MKNKKKLNYPDPVSIYLLATLSVICLQSFLILCKWEVLLLLEAYSMLENVAGRTRWFFGRFSTLFLKQRAAQTKDILVRPL